MGFEDDDWLKGRRVRIASVGVQEWQNCINQSRIARKEDKYSVSGIYKQVGRIDAWMLVSGIVVRDL